MDGLPPRLAVRLGKNNQGAQVGANYGGIYNYFGAPNTGTSRRRPTAVNVPVPNRDFKWVPALHTINKRGYKKPGRIALVGLAGIGCGLQTRCVNRVLANSSSKSQIALKYAERSREKHPGDWVFWVDASSVESFRQSYVDIANILDLEERRRNPTVDVLGLVATYLSSEIDEPWLMVLDGADDAATLFVKDTSAGDTTPNRPLSQYIPRSDKGLLLVTSRNRKIAKTLTSTDSDITEVNCMTRDAAWSLLRQKLKDFDRFVDENGDGDPRERLLQKLDFIPLAIVQAADYINDHTHMTVSSYLATLESSDHKCARLLRQNIRYRTKYISRSDMAECLSIVGRWRTTFELISSKYSSAADLLALMCFFNGTRISETLLIKHHATDCDDPEEETWEDLATLQRYYLITHQVNDHSYKMLSLVQFAIRDWLRSCGKFEYSLNMFIEVLRKETLTSGTEPEPVDLPTHQILLAHVEVLLQHQPQDRMAQLTRADILAYSARHICDGAKLSIALKLIRESVRVQQQILGETNIVTLSSGNELIRILLRAEQNDEAESVARQNLLAARAYNEDGPIVLELLELLTLASSRNNELQDPEVIIRDIVNEVKTIYGSSSLEQAHLIQWLRHVFESQRKSA